MAITFMSSIMHSYVVNASSFSVQIQFTLDGPRDSFGVCAIDKWIHLFYGDWPSNRKNLEKLNISTGEKLNWPMVDFAMSEIRCVYPQ